MKFEIDVSERSRKMQTGGIGRVNKGNFVDFFLLEDEKSSSWPKDEVSRDISRPREEVYVPIIRGWLKKCLEEHEHCLKSDYFLPSRVLDVGDDSASKIHLHISNNETAAYTALSHCWGLGPVVTTTRESFRERQEQIDFASLPLTFQNAIEVTRNLGIRYLWIDSLCIIQNDEQDWQTESATMAAVYSNAYLVIGADRSTSCHGGFLKPDNRGRSAFPIATVPGDDRSRCVVYARRRRWHDNIYDHEPLVTRAWTLQEHLLSSRMVHFTNSELIWDCRSHMYCECMSLSDSVEDYDFRANFNRLLKSLDPKSDEYQGQMTWVWNQLVNEQCKRNVTNEMDRLPCISGMASKLHANGTGEYMAGLWKNQLPECLLWSVIRPSDVRKKESMPTRFRPYRAPTWSWASLALKNSGEPSRLPLLNMDTVGDWPQKSFLVKIIEARSDPVGNDPFGIVRDGLIRFSAQLVPITVAHLTPELQPTQVRSLKSRTRPLFADAKFDIGLDDNDLRFPSMRLRPTYCALFAVGKSNIPFQQDRWAATGLILLASREQEGCMERIGVFEHAGRSIHEADAFFADAEETVVTLV